MSRYSLRRQDKKIAGVCTTVGELFNIDPTFVRIGFAALALLVSFKLAIAAYVATGLYLHFQKKKANSTMGRRSDLDRMEEFGAPRRTSVHELRTQLDANDRRMMAIDHHLHTQNDELAREIEALREEK